MFDAILYIAAIIFAFYLSNELDCKPAAQPTQEPVPTVEPEAIAPQPEVQDPWTEPTNLIQFPKFNFTSEVRTFEPISDEDKAIVETVFSEFNVTELRQACAEAGIKWRNANGKNKHMLKAQMITELTAAIAA